MSLNYDNIIRSISRVVCEFANNKTGYTITPSGTGFWLLDEKEIPYFVTNRHMIDAEYYNEKFKDYSLKKISMYLRTDSGSEIIDPTKLFNLKMDSIKIFMHKSADVAILSSCEFITYDVDVPHRYALFKKDFADLNYFKNRVNLLDPCSFIGYPGSESGPWWDEEFGLPIARNACIASYPAKDFFNHKIKSTNAKLVSGFSFNGSSGSPIFCAGTKIIDAGYIKIGGLIEYKCIGIMAGHLPTIEKVDYSPDIIKHSGLSFFVDSTAILELIQEVNTIINS